MLLRGIRWRLGPSLLTVLIAAIAVGAAVLGPLYLRAAGDSLVRSGVAAASVQTDGLTLSARTGTHPPLSAFASEQRSLTRRFELDRWYGRPLTTVSSPLGLTGPGDVAMSGQLLSRSGICGQVRMQAGSCRTGPGEVLVSTRTARAMHVTLGSTIRASVRGSAQPLQLRVSGLYLVPSFGRSYWWGAAPEYFAFGTASQHVPNMDAFITGSATVLDVPVAEFPSITVQLPLRPNMVGLGNRAQIEQLITAANVAGRAQQMAVTSRLPAVLAASSAQQHQMTTVVAVAAIQLVLLAVWVLAALLLRGADLRRSELRVARLRGFPFVSVLAVTVVEPALLCLAGAVIGVAWAWIAIVIAKDALLFPTATLSAGIWVIAAFAAVILTIAGVLSASALRVLREPASNQISASGERGSGRGTAIADAMLLVLSVVALVALASSGALARHGNPIASAAPGLLALGTAVVVVRLALLICRRCIPVAARSGRVAALLAFRQVTVRPALVRQGRVLIVALCLACFATCAWSVARSNRHTAAAFTVGAPTVVTVTPGSLTLQQAVAKADPRGDYAMAAVQIKTPSSSLMAVDAPRLAAVASWPDGITRASIEQVSRALQPRTVPELDLSSRSVSLTAHIAGMSGPRLHDLELGLWVFNAQTGTNIVTLGSLRPGTSRYSGSLADWCPGGCRLTGIGLVPVADRPVPGSGSVELTLRQLTSGGRSAPAANLSAAGWRSTATGVRVEQAIALGVTFVIDASALSNYAGGVLGSTAPAMASVADHPVNIPGVVTRLALYAASQSGGATTVATQGIDGNTISIGAAIAATALPRVGSNAELVDLTQLMRVQTDPMLPDASTDEVWLGPQAPADALARLQAAGLKLDSVERASAVYASLQHSGPALAYDFMLFATIVALVVAAASTLGVLGTAIGQRAAELTGLRVAGVGRRPIVRSLVFESSILAVTALFGAAAGAAGAALAIPSLPELSKALVAPLSYALPVPLIVLVAACVVVLIAIVTAVTGAEIIRRMSPTTLRTAPNDTGS